MSTDIKNGPLPLAHCYTFLKGGIATSTPRFILAKCHPWIDLKIAASSYLYRNTPAFQQPEVSYEPSIQSPENGYFHELIANILMSESP